MRSQNYLKCIVIVHGKSERQICSYIKTKLRFHMDIIGKSNGENSIQINGLSTFFNKDKRFCKYSNFITHFSDIELVTLNKKTSIAPYFKIFIIMDTDDCVSSQKERYINKELFGKHWAKEYIIPIYNSPELETVLTKAGIKFTKRGNDRKKEYIKIFPTDEKYSSQEALELKDFEKNLQKVNSSNLDIFIKYCLDISHQN